MLNNSPLLTRINELSGGVLPAACPAISAGLTLAAGGTLKQALLGAALSFAQVGAYSAVHGIIGSIGNQVVAGAAKLAMHAVIGGAVSMAQGGDFVSGALTGAVSAGAGLLMDSSGAMGSSGDGVPELAAARTAVAAVAGGTASVLSGGKFANGAITGAFAQMFNGEGGAAAVSRGLGRSAMLRMSATAATAATLWKGTFDAYAGDTISKPSSTFTSMRQARP